jgi:hypothetical protein
MKTQIKAATGKKFGFLTVVSIESSKKCKVKCDCGNQKIISIWEFNNCRHKSCGCKKSKLISSKLSKISKNKMHLYNRWAGMMARCNNKNHNSYKNYGGRGITVSEKWKNFNSFFDDMGNTYKKGMSIDRIDNNLGYFKENCKWSTPSEQARNTRKNIIIETPKGKMSLPEACELFQISYSALKQRIKKLNWKGSRLFSKVCYNKDNCPNTIKVKTPYGLMTLRQLSKLTGISYTVLKTRNARGYEWNKLINKNNLTTKKLLRGLEK